MDRHGRRVALASALALAAAAALALLARIEIRSMRAAASAPSREPRSNAPRADPLEPQDGADLRVPAANAAASVAVALESGCTPLSPLRVALVALESGERRAALATAGCAFDAVAPGLYRLACDDPDWALDGEPFAIAAATARVERIARIEPLGGWRGRVLDAESGRPLEGFALALFTVDRSHGAELVALRGEVELASEDGSFCAAASEPYGEACRLRVRAPGYADFQTGWLAYDGRSTIELGAIALERRARVLRSVAGVVRCARTGEPLARVDVLPVPVETAEADLWVMRGSLQLAGNPLADGRTVSADSGRFEVRLERVDALRLALFHPEHRLQLSEPIRLDAEHMRAELALALEEGARIAGRVATTAQVLREAAPLAVRIDGAGREIWVDVDAEGRFALGGLEAGAYRASLWILEPRGGGGSALSEVVAEWCSLAEGEERAVELRYRVDGAPSLAGRVELPAGVSFRMLRALLFREGELAPRRACAVSDDGGFELDEVEPGRYALVVGGSTLDHSRFLLARAELDTVAGEPPSPLVRAARPCVSGTVTERGALAAGAALALEVASDDPLLATVLAQAPSLSSDAAGEYALFGLPPGRYTLRRAAGVETSSFEIEAGSVRSLRVDVH